MRTSMSFITALSLAASALAGCVVHDAAPDTPGAGTLTLPLTQTGPHGEQFRLTSAIFDIAGGGGFAERRDPPAAPLASALARRAMPAPLRAIQAGQACRSLPSSSGFCVRRAGRWPDSWPITLARPAGDPIRCDRGRVDDSSSQDE